MSDFETVPAPKDSSNSDWESENPVEEPTFLNEGPAEDNAFNSASENEPKEKKNKTLMIVLIVAAVLLICCCCLVVIGAIVGLGSSGGDFESILDDLTYTPLFTIATGLFI
ncbi:MAG: hypothetical protein JEZ06_14120 [Anaerolineaceae bacterium]|nr:hypothetical protein [Anaerolineaceae bacterium]